MREVFRYVSFACCKVREFDRRGPQTERLGNITSLTHETGYCDMQRVQHRVEAKRRDDSAVESRQEGGSREVEGCPPRER